MLAEKSQPVDCQTVPVCLTLSIKLIEMFGKLSTNTRRFSTIRKGAIDVHGSVCSSDNH
jgi:hypothetical protein